VGDLLRFSCTRKVKRVREKINPKGIEGWGTAWWKGESTCDRRFSLPTLEGGLKEQIEESPESIPSSTLKKYLHTYRGSLVRKGGWLYT